MFDSTRKYEQLTRLGSPRTKNRKNLDRLTQDVLAAQKAGMSYGKWKAMHPNTGPDGGRQLDTGKFTFTCVNCGQEVVTRGHARRKYCCEQCRQEYYRERERERREAAKIAANDSAE